MSLPVAKQYILDFEQLGLGLFIHWGIYSQLGRGEWVYSFEQMKMDEYSKLKDTFTAEDFNAEELVLTAKKIGFRYITLTTRHHDGFSLYDTCGLNDFDAPHSASRRDLIREFVDACNKYDIKPFFYHTTLDWYNPDFNNDFDKYLDYLNKSVEILCKNYGKIGGLWFDGNWSKRDADWKESELYATIRKHQPEAMIINNTGLFKLGETGHPEIDSVTFERGRPSPMNREGMSKYLAAEMCQTLNRHWAYGVNDINYKSPSELIQDLCNCRKVGANLLLNIGPEGQGKINPYQRELLGLIGKWMDVFGEAIYNGRPCEIKGRGSNFALKSVDGKHIYFFIYNLGINGSGYVTVAEGQDNDYLFTDAHDIISEIKWMDEDEVLSFTQKDGVLDVNFTGFPYGKMYPVRVAKAILS